MVRKFLLILMAALVVFAFAQTSQAALSAVGPIDPGNGFPVFYTDPAALSLVPCLTENPANPAANPFCVVLADPFFDAVNPVVFPSNFPIEFFYWIADPNLADLGPNVKAIRFAMEGSFANLPTAPVNGFQTVFQRVRMRFTAPSAGTYTVTHPFGSKSFTGPAIINDTVDIPLGIPLDFATALTGPIGPFLQWDAGLPLVDPAGNQYIGDPTIAHTVTGSPVGVNSVTIDGPDIGGPGINTVTTSLFFVAGKIWNGLLPSGLTVERATYSRTPANAVEVDVFATGDLGATVTFTDGTTPAVTMATDPIDALSARFFGKSNPAAPPALVTVTSTLPPATPTVLSKTVTDLVTIASAKYSTSGSVLVVEAASSDALAPIPTLTEAGFGIADLGVFSPGPALTPPAQRLIVRGIEPPAQVNVTSSKGGSATELVTVVPSLAPIAVDDTANTNDVIPVVINLVANDIDLGGLVPGSIVVSNVVGGTVVPNSPSAGLVTFTAAAGFTGTATFNYTVANAAPFNLVSNLATVSITVNSPPIALDDTATTAANTPVTINVLANDTDPNNNLPLTVASVTQPAAGTGSVVNNGTSVGYTPPLNFTGTATFTYVAANSLGALSNSATVTVTVTANPTANPDSAFTTENTPVTINVLANDTNPIAGTTLTVATVSAVSPLTAGTVVNNGTSITFTPAARTSGVATFTYTAQAGAGGPLSNAATVTVSVDTITVKTSQYTVRNSQWNINGSATNRVGNSMTITLVRAGQPLVVIGTVPVGNNGSWQLKVTGSPVIAVAGDTLTVTSAFGNVLANVPIQIK